MHEYDSFKYKIGMPIVLIAALAVAGAAAPMKVRVGVPERENIQYLSLWVALGAGFLQAEGLDVELVVAPAGNQSGQLLLRDQADVALLQPPVYLGLIAQQRPIVLFANLLANDPINLVVRPDVAARLELDPKAPLVDRLRAMKGLRIGVANEPPRRLRVLLALAGMDADRDIQMTIVPGEEQIAAYTDGRVDALYTHTPFLEEALVGGGAALMVNQSAGEVAPLSHGEIHSMAAMRAYADAHPDVVLAVTRAIARAEALLHNDADAAGQALVKAGIPTPSPKHLATIIGLYRAAVPDTPAVSAAAVERNATLYPARPTMPDFTKVHAADFLAPAFAEKAVEAKAKQPFHLGVMNVNVTAPGAALSPVSDHLDQIEIQNRDAVTVNQAIEYLPGVSVDHKSPRNQTGISIGGFDSRQVPLHLDGVPAYAPYDGYVDLTRYLTSDVAEIQVAKGYSSSLLGPNALGGVVNLVTRQPQKHLEGDALLGSGAGGLVTAGMHVGARWQRLFMQASTDRLQSDFFPMQDGAHRTNSDQRDERYRLRAGWTPRGEDSYVVSYSNQQGTSGVPPYSGTAPACPSGNAGVTTPCVTPKYWRWPEWNTDGLYFNSRTGFSDADTLRFRAFYVRYANTLAMFDDAAYSTMNQNASSGVLANRDHSVGVSGDFETRRVARNTIGASFFVKDDTHAEETTTFSRTNSATTTPGQTYIDRQSSFGFQDVISVSSRISATVGVSADGLNNRLWAFNPVGSISYAAERLGSIVISGARKSRFPTIKDRFSAKAGRAIPNPALRPERAWTWTAGYSRAFALRTVAQIEVFRSDVHDEIENTFFLSPLCTAGKGGAGVCMQAVNVGSEIHEGVNVTVRTTPVRRVTLDANYSHLHREITGARGVFPTGTPTHKTVGTATVRLPRGATGFVSARYQNGIVAMSDNGLPLPTARFGTIDVGGTLPIRAGLRVQAGVKNLFDRDYYYWEGFPEPGRSASVTLRYAF